jgi:predicted ATPase
MLGPLEVRADDGTPVELPGVRLRTLLIRLALDPGRVVTTDQLIDCVWGDAPPAEVNNALQALVSRLRRAGFTVESRHPGYRLDVPADHIDAHRFERLVAAGDPRAALALWRGPALADAADAAFASAPVVRLTELWLGALGDRLEADLAAAADPNGLVAELESLHAEHPLRERFAALLMRALSRAGRPGDALAVHAQVRQLLADELGADPSAELAAAHLAVLRGEPDAAPRTNLRAGLTSFVGRDQELTTVASLVERSRLVTLTGPGGSGKTRLATELGRRRVGPGEAVWFVELAPVGDGTALPQAVLAALGIRPQALVGTPGRGTPEPADPVERLAAALSTRPVLLVLDNCEHVIEAAAALADRLLGDCPALRIVATSREPLGITGETLWPVDPLPLPPPGVPAEEALTYAAMRLFADRAAAVRPTLEVDEAMAHICRALDGMPLAIELAAARLRTMSPAQLATRLDDRFRLLTGGSRMALPRHQTLRAVVDWSWDLLDEAERVLLARLSVFAGGATLDAAERVCGGDLDVLSALVDKSLVVLDGDRYRMLETIKAYGAEKLVAAGERDQVVAAHVAYFLTLAEAAEPHLRRAEQLDWLGRLAAEHDNLNTAMRAAVAAGDAMSAVRLLASVGWYWWLRGHKVEGGELAQDVVELAGAAPDEDRALAYAMAAMLAIDGHYDEDRAGVWFTDAIDYARAMRHRHPLLRLIVAMGEVLRAFGFQAAPAPAAVELPDNDDPWVRGTVRVMRAHAALNSGRDHESAEDDFRAGLALFRSVGERWGMSFALCSLADLMAWRGESAAAVSLYEEAVELFAQLVTNEDLVRYRLRLASLYVQLDRWDEARAVVADAARDAEQAGLPLCLAGVAHARGEFARLTGDYAVARRELERAAALADHVTVAPQFQALIASSVGYLDVAQGDLAAALVHHTEALDLALGCKDAPVIAQVLVGAADLAVQRGDPLRAALLLGASAGIRGMADLSLLDYPRVEAATRAALGDDAFTEAVARGQAVTTERVRELAAATP